jgi:hypothetical protein
MITRNALLCGQFRRIPGGGRTKSLSGIAKYLLTIDVKWYLLKTGIVIPK